MKPVFSVTALLLSLSLSACVVSTTGPDRNAAAGTDALAQVGHWRLQGATDTDGARIDALFPNGKAVYSLHFDAGRVGIIGGCNQMSGRYRIDAEGRLIVSEVVSTLMACEDRALMSADAAMAGLLEGPSDWRIAESYPEQLYMDHAGGRASSWVAERQMPGH